jgi:DNA-binding transcriptional regulator of glucitol operon
MNSTFLRLQWRDAAKGAALAVILAVGQFILSALQNKGFALTSADFTAAGDLAVKAFSAYLLKNLLSTEDGKFLGSIG